MESSLYQQLYLQASQATQQLLQVANLQKGSIVVVGCSSSEIIGGQIGKQSSLQVAQAVFEGIFSQLQPKGIHLAAQCCEHLNRAIVLSSTALKPWQQPVSVIPQPKAGGSFATIAWQQLPNPVVLEEIQADAGLDIGATLIGMHLKAVAVPVRLQIKTIGQALVIAARTRPKYIGGERACYSLNHNEEQL